MAALRSSLELGVKSSSLELGANSVVTHYRGRAVEIRVNAEVKVKAMVQGLG